MQHYHLHFASGCGIIIVSRGERNKPLLGLSPSEVKLGTPHKKHERTSRKPLDKLHKVWYNDNVKREVVSNQRSGKLMAPMGDCAETTYLFN